jgi:hypothetical protein
MLKPTDDELREALAEAERMREQGADPHHVAKVLQYLDHHTRSLEKVFQAAKHYIHSGLAEREHSILENAIEALRGEELHDTDREDETLGL